MRTMSPAPSTAATDKLYDAAQRAQRRADETYRTHDAIRAGRAWNTYHAARKVNTAVAAETAALEAYRATHAAALPDVGEEQTA